MLLFFTTKVAEGHPLQHCQPHEVEALAVRLGIPVVATSCRRRPCGHDDRGHLYIVGKHEQGTNYYLDGSEQDHVGPSLDAAGQPVLGDDGAPVMDAVLSPHERDMHATHVCHNHVWFEVPDGYTLPPEIDLKLRSAMEQGEPVSKPLGIPLPPGITAQAAIAALGFPGHEVCHGEHGPMQYISGPLGLQAVYCCLDCKDRHDAARCQQVLSRLPDPATRPVRGSQTVEKRVPLERKLVTAGGQVITHELVTAEVLEDKAIYRERLRQWYLASGCWA